MKILLICLLTISCYNNPLSNKVSSKNKPLYIRQYEERNRKEEMKQKSKHKKVEVIKPKERKIKYNFKGDFK